MRITLDLTPVQAQHIVRALDLYVRVQLGQLESVADLLRLHHPRLDRDRLEQAQALFGAAKTLLWSLTPTASHGLHNKEVPDAARQAYDIKETLQDALYPRGSTRVPLQEPTSTLEALPVVTVER